ncbi:MAG: hypothetical protein FIA97_06230 [Methylococcaceae bacterium]|nr:hypothetical protein [Methylococcaceae bacterium]
MASLDQFRQQLDARLAALTARERVYVAVALCGLVFTGWDYGVNTPLIQERKRAQRGLEEVQARLTDLGRQVQVVVARGQIDPNAAVRQRLDQLQSETKELQSRREALAAAFMSPYEIADLLRNILKGRGELRLVGLATQAARPLLETPSNGERKAAESDSPMIYRHDLVVELEGGYFAVLDYLRALENQPLFWEAAELTVTAYPVAKVRLQVYTLSFQKEWLGV